MNSVFALMIITVTGVVEAPNNFSSLADCEKVVQRIQLQSYCIEKKPVNVENEFNKVLSLFKSFQKEMEK